MAEFAEFRDINNRLKKRFNLLRKPNLKEASESYRKLSQKLSSFPNYSGYCLYTAAKCEHQIVGSLKEQLNNHSSLTSSSSNTSGANLVSPNATLPPSSVSSSSKITDSSSNRRTNHALENLVNESIWIEFQTWLDSARKFREIDVIENDLNGAISAYAHAIQTCPSPRILTVVLGELATLYIKHHRFYDAAEVFIEAGLYREAINCLLRGHFYQDAYHCYQELFKKQTNFENYSSFTDRMYSSSEASNSGKTNQSSATTNASSQSKSSILNLFKKKQDNESTIDNNKSKESPDFNRKILPPLKQSLSPFDFSEKNLTIDDYINFFLLRLYLYDPVKYEYPSPIIPIPRHCSMDDNLPDQNDNQEEFDGDLKELSSDLRNNPQLSSMLLTEELSSPFFDLTNSRWMDRSIDDIIELNHLLETLYLSYRNELRPSIDNEYSDFDFIQKSQTSDCIASDEDIKTKSEDNDSIKLTKESSIKQQCSDSEETEEGADDSSSSGHGFASSTRYDSKDSTSDEDQHQQKHHHHSSKTSSTIGGSGEPKSPALKLFETGELDDISERLKQLAKKMSDYDQSSAINNQTDDNNLPMQVRVKKKLDKIEREWMQNNDDQIDHNGIGFMFDNDEQLRQQISYRLYPLLNGNQIQLLYDILEEKN